MPSADVGVNVPFSERFTKVLLEQQQDRAKREQERIRLLTADPFDLEAQAKIEEDIRYTRVFIDPLSMSRKQIRMDRSRFIVCFYFHSTFALVPGSTMWKKI